MESKKRRDHLAGLVTGTLHTSASEERDLHRVCVSRVVGLPGQVIEKAVADVEDRHGYLRKSLAQGNLDVAVELDRGADQDRAPKAPNKDRQVIVLAMIQFFAYRQATLRTFALETVLCPIHRFPAFGNRRQVVEFQLYGIAMKCEGFIGRKLVQSPPSKRRPRFLALGKTIR